MFETSQTTEKLDQILAKVQGEIKPAIKDSENPHFRSSYADIAAVWGAIRPAIAKHGVNVTQWLLETDGNKVKILTRIAYAGEWMRSTWSIPVSKADAQGYGSAATYARRFTLMAALGVAPEDDDGNMAVNRPAPIPSKTTPQVTPKKQFPDTHDFEVLMSLVKQKEWPKDFLHKYLVFAFNTVKIGELDYTKQFVPLLETIKTTPYTQLLATINAVSKDPGLE